MKYGDYLRLEDFPEYGDYLGLGGCELLSFTAADEPHQGEFTAVTNSLGLSSQSWRHIRLKVLGLKLKGLGISNELGAFKLFFPTVK